MELCQCSTSPLGIISTSLANNKDTTTENSDQALIITFESLGVQVYNLATRKCEQSWSVKPGTRLSSKVCFHARSSSFVCVENDKTLCHWGRDSSPTEAKRRSFANPVKEVHAASTFAEILVVFTNGTVMLCSADDTMHSVHTSSTPKKSEVLLSQVCVLNSQTVVAVLRRQAKQSRLVLDLYQIRKTKSHNNKRELIALAGCSLKNPYEGSNLVSFSLGLESRQLSLLWSGEEGSDTVTWEVLQFNKSCSLSEALKEAPQATLSRKMAGTPSASAFFASNYVAIYGSNDGSSTVTAWETMYGTMQGQAELPLQKKTQSRGRKKQKVTKKTDEPAPMLSISENGNYCAILTNSSVYVTELSDMELKKPSLASALGRLGPSAELLEETEKETLLTPPVSNTIPMMEGLRNAALVGTQPQEIDVECCAASSALEEIDLKESQLLSILVPAEEKDTPQLPKFNELFEDYLASKAAADLGATKKNKKRKAKGSEIRKEGAVVPKGSTLSYRLVSAVASRCVALKYWDPLEVLVRSNLLSARACSKLVQELVKAKETQVLEQVLQHVHDIAEEDLCRVLAFALGNVVKTSTEAAKNGEAVVLLDLVISSPRNDSFLHSSLRNLGSEEFTALLHHLYGWVVKFWQEIQPASNESRTPAFSQVIDWVSVCLDSRFTDLVLLSSAENKQLLQAFHKLSGSHLSVCEAMEPLKGVLTSLASLQDGRVQPPQPPLGDYTVQMFTL